MKHDTRAAPSIRLPHAGGYGGGGRFGLCWRSEEVPTPWKEMNGGCLLSIPKTHGLRCIMMRISKDAAAL